MKILALESSAVACSACLTEDERLIAQAYENSGMTHSKTLLPMAEELLNHCGAKMEDIDLFAVAAGPGSFTGLRIGVSACKGLAWALEKPCAGVSTLEAMAWGIALWRGEICCVMDARRSQVYNARFTSDGETITRLTPDRAIGLEELAEELKQAGSEPLLVGDGVELAQKALTERGLTVHMPPPNLRYQTAWGVARGALEQARAGALTTAADLTPNYHRLSQAERERLEKENTAKK